MNTLKKLLLTVLASATSFAVMANDISFEAGGDAPWFQQSTVTYDGTSAWQVGDLKALGSDDYVDSTLTLTVQGPCTLTFQYGVKGTSDSCSCYLDSDYVSLQRDSWSDSLSWTLNTITISEAGEHTIEFSTYYCSSWYSESYTPSKFWIANVQRIAAPASVTVSFDANGGYCTTSSRYYETGVAYGDLPTPYRSQGEFQGWYTSAIGGVKVADGDCVKFDVTQLYARWGMPIEDALGVDENVSISVDTNWQTQEPYWYGNVDYSYDGNGCACAGFDDNYSHSFDATAYGPGTLSFVARCVNSSFQALIQKQLSEYSYTSENLASIYSHWYGTNVYAYSVNGFKVTKSYIGGWVRFDIEAYGAGEHKFEFYGYPQSDSDDACAFVDCMSWTPATGSVVVKFEVADGVFLGDGIYSPGEMYGSLPEPIRAGYVFAGWCTDEDLMNQVKTSDYVPFAGAHLYAKWKKTLALDNGNWYESEATYTTGEKVYRTDIVTNGAYEADNGYGYTQTYYTYPTSYIEYEVTGAGFFSLWLNMSGYTSYPPYTISVDGEQVDVKYDWSGYSYVYGSDEVVLSNWQKQNLTISGSGKHKVRVSVNGGSSYSPTTSVVMTKGDEFESYAKQATLGKWTDKTRNYDCWVTDNLSTLQSKYASDKTPKGHLQHAFTTLLTMGENASVKNLLSGFGFTIDYMTMNLNGKFNNSSSAPTGNRIVDTLMTVGEPLVKASLADLEAIPSTMASFELTPDDFAYFDETMTIDYGDILYLRSALKGLLGFAYWSKAYNVEMDYSQHCKDVCGAPITSVSNESKLLTEAGWNEIDWLEEYVDGNREHAPFKVVKSGTSIYVYALRDNATANSTYRSLWIKCQDCVTKKCAEGYYSQGNGYYYSSLTASLVAELSNADVYSMNVSGVSDVSIANLHLRSVGGYLSNEYRTWTAKRSMMHILHQTKIMNKIRNASALTTAKNYIKEALQIWKQADAKVVARTDSDLHLIEYDVEDEDTRLHIAAMRNNFPKALQSLNDGSVQEYDWLNMLGGARGREAMSGTLADPLAINVNKLFTGEITRSILPKSVSDDYYVPAIYELDPTLNGLTPETTRSEWAAFLDAKHVERSGESPYTFDYEENDDGTITLTSIVGEEPTGDFDVPSSYDGKTVTAVGEGLLNDFNGITAVSIPATVTWIAEGSIQCPSCKSVTVADGNTRYDVIDGLLYDCIDGIVISRANSTQKTFVIPDGATRIADIAFARCSGGVIAIPATVTNLGCRVFCECSGLTVNFLGGVPSADDCWDEEHQTWDYEHLFIGSTNVRIIVPTGCGWEDACVDGKWQYRTVTMKTFVTVTAGEGGTATGGGAYDSGTKITLRATAAKGYVFAGWYEGEVAIEGDAGADYRTASMALTIPAYNRSLTAKFVTKAEDSFVSVSCPLDSDGYTAGQTMSATVTVESASFPTVTAKGLPAGVKFDAKTLVLSGVPMTPGEYPIVFTAKNVSGATASTTATFKVNNYICSLNYLDEPLQDSYDLTPGVAIDGEAVFGSQVLAELGLGGWTVTGLPAGITYNAKTGTFTGAATAASKNYTVTFTKKEGSVVKEIGTSIFRTSAFPKLSLVAVIDGDTYETKTNGWRLVGAGAYPANRAVSLSAAAPSGFVFTGWTFDEAGSDPLSNGKQDFRTSSGYSYTTLAEDTTLYAHFTHKRNDDVLTMDLESSYTINSAVEMQLSVQSWSLPTVKATGLPTGLKFDAKTLVLSGTPTKPGKYTVTFMLSNLTLKNVTQTTEITVPNIVSDKIGGIESNEDYYQYTQGVAIGDGIVPEVEDGYALSVSGLPSGLSYDRKTGKITGAPTAKPGAYTVAFTATKRGAATETATITLNVAAAPTSAVGVFNGFVGRDEGASFVNLGTFKLTSAANGALSAVLETAKGKTSLTAKNWTSYDGAGIFDADFSDRSGNAVHIVIDVSLGFDAWQLSGTFYEAKSGATHDLIAQMNVFGQSWYFKATAAGTDAWTLAYAESASSADLTVTTKADGTATIKGKLGTYSVNATSFLATDGLRDGAFMADFVQFVTVSGTKYPLSISANLWLDGSDAHTEGAGSAKVEE